ncbi:hypothetical protein [Synechococcus sp. CCY9202]|nr:hypothetical protein [Synechococcus sp. CCY9202]MEA5422350.1 hypothetical protein [Synechococcus sp. CCY9202]
MRLGQLGAGQLSQTIQRMAEGRLLIRQHDQGLEQVLHLLLGGAPP